MCPIRAEGVIMSANTNTKPNTNQEVKPVANSTVNYTDPKLGNLRDKEAPQYLTIEIKDQDGQTISTLTALAKDFSSGSVGYYAGEKIGNPKNPIARYQVGINVTLIKSKPNK
jgi:hypothetical protein